MTAKAIVHVTEVITVAVEFRAPKKGDLMWCVSHDCTIEDALDSVLRGREDLDSGTYGYAYPAHCDHPEFEQLDKTDPLSRSRNIVVHVRLVSESLSPIRLL